MVKLKYQIRAQIISIIEFGWSVFVLVFILRHITDLVNSIDDPKINGLFITTFVTSIASSVLQLLSTVLLSFGSVGLEIDLRDVEKRLKFIEIWDILTGWRICLLLPSAFFPALTIIKTSELLLSVVNVFLVYDYLLELQDNVNENQISDLSPPYTRTSRVGTGRFQSLFIRTRRLNEIRNSNGTQPGRSTIIEIHGTSANMPSPPPYEPPPKYDDIVVEKPISNLA